MIEKARLAVQRGEAEQDLGQCRAHVTNNPALLVRNHGWDAFFDQDGKEAEETRRKVYDMLVAEKMLVQGFHYPFPPLGHVEREGGGYRIVQIYWTRKV